MADSPGVRGIGHISGNVVMWLFGKRYVIHSDDTSTPGINHVRGVG